MTMDSEFSIRNSALAEFSLVGTEAHPMETAVRYGKNSAGSAQLLGQEQAEMLEASPESLELASAAR